MLSLETGTAGLSDYRRWSLYAVQGAVPYMQVNQGGITEPSFGFTNIPFPSANNTLGSMQTGPGMCCCCAWMKASCPPGCGSGTIPEKAGFVVTPTPAELQNQSWHFQAYAKNAWLYLDEYSELSLHSLDETVYQVQTLLPPTCPSKAGGSMPPSRSTGPIPRPPRR